MDNKITPTTPKPMEWNEWVAKEAHCFDTDQEKLESFLGYCFGQCSMEEFYEAQLKTKDEEIASLKENFEIFVPLKDGRVSDYIDKCKQLQSKLDRANEKLKLYEKYVNDLDEINPIYHHQVDAQFQQQLQQLEGK